MSSSKERVGGVEPETVEMYRARDFPEARWMECAPDTRHTIALYPNEYEVERFVEASALRLVEEELRQAREERDAMREMYARSVAARVDYLAARDAAEADRDRLAAERDAAVRELELHKKARLAHRAAEARAAALSPVQGEHEQDGEDTGVVGDSALSGESVRNDDSEATR